MLIRDDFVADVIGKPSIDCHVASDNDAPKDLQTTRPFAFPSAIEDNRWCLRACWRGALSGMDAAPAPTWTYSRRVPGRLRASACRRPKHWHETDGFVRD
ncbi:hypothetical protein XAP6164_760001 [Xanthomonas phaseoli pv. phaseoli]|nr:hypothetical protein XAP6164_760001 [Xanthomonas phaseoli pv. phaseoli]